MKKVKKIVKINLNINAVEENMLKEITSYIVDVKNENSINKEEMNEAIRALILKNYISEIVPIKYGKHAVVNVERNEK